MFSIEKVPVQFDATYDLKASVDTVIEEGDLQIGQDVESAVIGVKDKAEKLSSQWVDEVGKVHAVKDLDQSKSAKIDSDTASDVSSHDAALVSVLAELESADGSEPISIRIPSRNLRRYNTSDPSYYTRSSTSEWSTAFTACVNEGRLLRLKPGRSYDLANWIAPAGTRLFAHGATIRQFTNDAYEAGSGASMIVTNDDIEVHGGTWTRVSAPAIRYRGSILVERGSLMVYGSKFMNTWGGIFGHKKQNADRIADRVQILNSEFNACAHNCWLADIRCLVYRGNNSHSSRRDGMRLYRNIESSMIVGNHLHDNGDPSAVDQSRDGIDCFNGGRRMIIAHNVIERNLSAGIDIKSGKSPQSIAPEKFFISHNVVRNNGYEGIKAHGNPSGSLIPHVHIVGNSIDSNNAAGVWLDRVTDAEVRDNNLHENGDSAIRVGAADGVRVEGNSGDGNCKVGRPGWTHFIHIERSVANAMVVRNSSRNRAGTQAVGIAMNGSGRMMGNDISGHGIDVVSVSKASRIIGSTLTQSVNTWVIGAENDGDITIAYRAAATVLVAGVAVTFSTDYGTSYDLLVRRVDVNGGAAETIFESVVASLGRSRTVELLPLLDGADLCLTSGQLLHLRSRSANAIQPVLFSIEIAS